MTERVMEPCSPAERGTPCNGLCCALTGAPQRGNPNPRPQTQGPDKVMSSTGKRSGVKVACCVWTGGKSVSLYLSVLAEKIVTIQEGTQRTGRTG